MSNQETTNILNGINLILKYSPNAAFLNVTVILMKILFNLVLMKKKI